MLCRHFWSYPPGKYQFQARKAGLQEFDFLKRDPDGSKIVVTRRPIKFREIAILLRKMKPDTGRKCMKALSRHDILYYTP